MLLEKCSRGCVREPISYSPSLLPQHRRATPAKAPRLQVRSAIRFPHAAAQPCSRVTAALAGQLQQRLGAHAPPQPPQVLPAAAAAAAAAVQRTPASSREEPYAAGDSGNNNGGNDNSSCKRVGEDDDGSNSRDSAGSLLFRLLAGMMLLQQLVQAGPAAAAWGSGSRVESKQEELRLLPAWEIDAFVDRMWDLSGPILNNMGFSGLLGAASAAALKWVGRTLAAAVGLSLLLVQVLSHYDVVTVNWSVVHHQAQQVLDRTGDGRLDKDDYKRVLKQGMVIMSEGVPSVSGFLVGFVVGLKLF